MTYGIVGVGAIATAIVTGLCERVPDAQRIVLSPRNAERVADLASRFPTVRVARSNQEVIDESSVVLLCLRPQDARSVLPDLKFSAHQEIVSAMAGIQIATLRELVAPAQNIARVIPLPSVATREGATPVFPPTAAAKALFDQLGTAIEIPNERAFEATSASTATIAAHFAYLNAICRWLIAQGVSEMAARQQVAATFAGLAPQLRGHVADFAEGARDHATPGGTNEQFLGILEQARVFDAVETGLNRVLERLAGRSA
ncbi:MAG TPA: NAD(P)-binding domain-containing protein [Steroidobacteraceae bacterium]|jgi:pyrroline-5-carboxylate reductase|nr:NAD(P)-binding domain-containing protein [Steroidobacteraceae bacterium]